MVSFCTTNSISIKREKNAKNTILPRELKRVLQYGSYCLCVCMYIVQMKKGKMEKEVEKKNKSVSLKIIIYLTSKNMHNRGRKKNYKSKDDAVAKAFEQKRANTFPAIKYISNKKNNPLQLMISRYCVCK